MRIIVFLLMLFIHAFASADAVLTFKTSNPRSPDKIEIKDSKIRLSNENDSIVTLFDNDKKKLTLLNHKEKNYYTVTEKKLKDAISAIRKIQQDMKKGLTVEQQKTLDDVFEKQGLAFNPNAVKQSTKEMKKTNFKGIDCTVVVTLINEQVDSTHCIATARYLGVNSADFNTYLNLMHFLKQISFGLDSIDSSMKNGFAGLPIVSYDKKGDLINKFISLRSSNLPKELFAIPKGYVEVGQP